MAKNSKQESLYEKVVHDLKSKIVSGIYRKGDILPSEKELIYQYSVSRITIRKALSILTDMGFIETSQGKGSVVLFGLDGLQKDGDFAKAAEQHLKEFRSSTQVRLMLEPEIARLAARQASKEQVQYLKLCLNKNTKDKDNKVNDFHIAIASIIDNSILDNVLEHLLTVEQNDTTLGLIFPENQQEIAQVIAQQHEKIYEAIKNKDSEFAYFYMKEHTLYMAKLYEEYYSRLK